LFRKFVKAVSSAPVTRVVTVYLDPSSKMLVGVAACYPNGVRCA
jgi:hypothetical protein